MTDNDRMTNAKGDALLELFQAARQNDRDAGEWEKVAAWDVLIRGLCEE